MNESLFYRDQILIVRICVVQMQNRTVTSDLLRTLIIMFSLVCPFITFIHLKLRISAFLLR